MKPTTYIEWGGLKDIPFFYCDTKEDEGNKDFDSYLLKRGHRLVADDAVEIRRISDSLYGSAPEIIRHYIEIRGIGIIDVQQLFGMGAVQFDSDIEIVIHLEPWQDGKFYDRLGLEGDTYTILGVQLPYVTIPVRPGRNLAGIVEAGPTFMVSHVNIGNSSFSSSGWK